MSGETQAAAGSPLARLRELAQADHRAELFLPIPGARWGGQLVARVVIVGPDAARAKAEEIAASGADRDKADMNADLIATFTGGLYLRDQDGDGLVPIPGPGGTPMRFGPEFAAEIGAAEGVTTPRGAVFAAFTEGDEPPTLNVSALSTFAGVAAAWLADTSTTIEGSIVSGR